MVAARAASTVCSAATRVFREPTMELITVPAMPTAATPPVIQAAVMIGSTSGTLAYSTESRPAARRPNETRHSNPVSTALTRLERDAASDRHLHLRHKIR